MGEPARPLAFLNGDAKSADRDRFRELVAAHMSFVWRSLRRLGVPNADADDLAQDAFLIASRRLDTVAPECERSFLFGTAMRLAAAWRRGQRVQGRSRSDAVDAEHAPGPGADDALGVHRERAAFGQALDALSEELRVVFVLCELDELTMAEVAARLNLPHGTVASRLRRARADFRSRVLRMRLAGEL